VGIRQVVIDFDGTCTRVDEVHEAFLRAYRLLVATEWGDAAAALWDEGEAAVRAASPTAGWMLGGTPAAPAAADPYILSSEVVAWIDRSGGAGAALPATVGSWYKRAYLEHPAPWRDEVPDQLRGLHGLGVRIAFVSNSASGAIRARLEELVLPHAVREAITVVGDAAKFKVRELGFDRPHPEVLASRFRALPAADASSSLGRPLYLRRGSYFEALISVLTAGLPPEGPVLPEETLVCGDVWELDLAMPSALGAQVHLVTRADPYATCTYELEAANRAPGAEIDDDLRGVVDRVRRGQP
jgi:phosphoglycolate phosphatase-like HAD superfamily hydrolase